MATANTPHFPIRTCKEHTLEELVAFCKDCQVFVCINCARGDHINHHCEGVSKFAREVRSRIPETCEQVRKESLSKMQANLNVIDGIVNENIQLHRKENHELDVLQDENIKAIQCVVNKLKSERSSTLEAYNAELQAHRDDLEEKVKTLDKRIKTHMESQAEYTNHDAIEMDKELKDIAKQYTPLGFNPRSFVLRSSSNQQLLLTELGHIEAKLKEAASSQKAGMYMCNAYTFPKSKIVF